MNYKTSGFALLMIFASSLGAESNLGTLTSIRNGFGGVSECEQTEADINKCGAGAIEGIESLLEFATTNQCVAAVESYENSGVEVPKCPSESDAIKGLDNTHPSGGIFALYTEDNVGFLHDMAANYLRDNPNGKFNLVLPRSFHDSFRAQKDLIALLNNKQVNIIEVETMPAVDRWMQDSFQFTALDGKPALYQLQHGREKDLAYEDRLACQIAKSCDIPYFIPPDMIDPFNGEDSNLDMGGNLEVLPGGTFYRGIVKTKGFEKHVGDAADFPWQSDYQKEQRKALEAAGNNVIDLDTSFLHVGHVDEIINIVKTNKPAPCNFAVMLASPQKAFELMEEEAAKIRRQGYRSNHGLIDLIFPQAHAAATALGGGKKTKEDDKCEAVSYFSLNDRFSTQAITAKDLADIYALNCMNDQSIENFVASENYQIYKRQNLEGTDTIAPIAQVMENNRRELIAELQKSSGCENPPVIDVPVFFRSGLSFAPDLVNGVVHTPPGSPSSVILPRTYFKPFDDYTKNELAKYGVTTSFAHDMGYHLSQGEVHCGTNTARICRP